MATRSLTHVKERGATLCTIYRQFDGYPSGIGKDIFAAFGAMQICNGISDESAPAFANGMGCFAAQLISTLKGNTIGNVYLYPPDSDDCGEDYTYTIYANAEGNLCIKCDGIFDGLLSDFGAWIDSQKE